MTFQSGHPAVDRFIAQDYESVRGMSSRFAATICAHILRRQTALGIGGHFAEVGTFEGRFFIAMALGLQPDEIALGIDSFDWPDEGLLDRFHGHCARLGLGPERYRALKASTRDLTPADVAQALPGKVRFWHIDGDHRRESLTHDLDLAAASLHPHGILCLDDMLHPGYPFLVLAVQAWLARNPQMCMLAILDREDIVAAAKILICSEEAVELYGQDLVDAFPQHHYRLGADCEGYDAVVLTPQPRLADVGLPPEAS